MMSSSDAILVEYLRRAYQAVDGLWFTMVEEQQGFQQALELDRRVWKVLAKIQARKARQLTGCAGNSTAELARCFALKLTADGHRFDMASDDTEVQFVIFACPWLELLRKSGRRHVAATVAQAVCLGEGRVWGAEFGGYHFAMPRMMCDGADRCEMVFARTQIAEHGEQ